MDSLTQLAFFAPNFWFPALIAASVFPSLIAYSGPIFSAVALWIVFFVLIAGLVMTMASGYSLGHTHRLESTAALVQTNLGSFLGAFAAAASLLGLVFAVAALVSTATTFVVVSLGLDESFRKWILIAGFVILLISLLYPFPVRIIIPWFSAVIFVVGFLVVGYGFFNYFLGGADPSLIELLGSTSKAKEVVTEANFTAGWQAVAVAALLLVPAAPSVSLIRNENRQPLSAMMFRVLGASSAAMFAAIVYLSFTVAGFHWTRLDTVIQGPGNLALLLEIMLEKTPWLAAPIMVVLALGCLMAAYTYVSSASNLLSDLGLRDLVPRQVPVFWARRGRSASVLFFMVVAFAVALYAHTRMDLVALTWVLFVAISSFLGQVARQRMWRSRLARGETYRQRREAKRYYLIAILSVIISLIILVVVSVAFSFHLQVIVMSVWIALGLVFFALHNYYRKVEKKMSQLVHAETPVKHTMALALVSHFDASAVKTIRYAWAAHHPQMEVLRVVGMEESEAEVLTKWRQLNLSAPLTLISNESGDYLQPVEKYIRAKLELDPDTSVSIYLPRRVTRFKMFGFLHNVTERFFARHLSRLSRVTVTWVSIEA